MDAARRLSFAQTLAAGETSQEGTLSGSLVRWRNARALEEVDAALAAGCTRLALLYGALHQRDMRSRLLQRFTLEAVSEPEWQAAWRIPVPRDEGDTRGMATLAVLAVGLFALDAAVLPDGSLRRLRKEKASDACVLARRIEKMLKNEMKNQKTKKHKKEIRTCRET